MDQDAVQKSFDDLAYAIGLLFINVGGFEHILNLTVAAALGLNHLQERALLRGMQSRSKIEILELIGKKAFVDEAKDKLKVLTNEARTIADFRNDIAHGLLTYDQHGAHHVITFKGDNRFEGKAKELKSATVSEYAVRAIELAGQFQALLNLLEKQQGRPTTPLPFEHPST
jgi:hypothetical protein